MPIPKAKHILLFGGTGTIGRATTQALLDRGHSVTCVLRQESSGTVPEGADSVHCDVTNALALEQVVFGAARYDAVICCLASRTGAPQDAWAIDHRATVNVIEAAKSAGIGQFVLLSAICVQKPRLAFQHAKLKAEAALMASGLTYSIVRPTAYFKSLAGQIARVQQGKPYLLFGDGKRTACTPISDRDLGQFMVDCLEAPDFRNRVLPIGGPGAALTPRAMGEHLFSLLGKPPEFKHVPVGLMRCISGGLGGVSKAFPPLAPKAEFARIGLYYATESMLALNPDTGQYDRALTPSTGSDTLFDYYADVLSGRATVERGDHSVF